MTVPCRPVSPVPRPARGISTAKKILHTLDSPETSLASTFEIAQHALGVVGSSSAEPSPDVRDRVRAICGSNGWTTTDANPGIDVAARALDGLSTVGFEPPGDYLQAYAFAAETIARADLAALLTRDRPDLIAELMVVGTVFGDPLLAGLRRLAQQSVSNEFFPSGPSEQTPKKAETKS